MLTLSNDIIYNEILLKLDLLSLKLLLCTNKKILDIYNIYHKCVHNNCTVDYKMFEICCWKYDRIDILRKFKEYGFKFDENMFNKYFYGSECVITHEKFDNIYNNIIDSRNLQDEMFKIEHQLPKTKSHFDNFNKFTHDDKITVDEHENKLINLLVKRQNSDKNIYQYEDEIDFNFERVNKINIDEHKNKLNDLIAQRHNDDKEYKIKNREVLEYSKWDDYLIYGCGKRNESYFCSPMIAHNYMCTTNRYTNI